MKIKNNIFKGIILGMVLMTIMTVKVPIAEANNYEDTDFKEFYSGYNIVETKYRYKSDDSSAYIFNSGSPCSVYVDVWGGYAVFDDAGNASVRPTQQECCNYNGNVLVGKGQAKKLLNNVNERKWNAAQLRMTGTQLRVYLSGKWSPDSI
ncbi:hypothetical protein [Clostridium sp. UBA7503]|uniref:hypothetical protein n=1 Tax=Clostridium sp. UBA7503 TaxID=1946377 RepID=UPI003216B642